MTPKKLKAVPNDHVRIDDSFWTHRLNTLKQVTVPHVFDKFEDNDGGAFNNFDRVAQGEKGGHKGSPWFDGLIYETICGASKLLSTGGDKNLVDRMDGYIARIAAAQAAGTDGYINTNTILLYPDKRWGENGGNLRWQHEVYNAGCLVEAAVHHYRATLSTSFLDVAVGFAEHITSYIGPPPKKNIVPAHSLPEDAFVELYRLFQQNPDLQTKYPNIAPHRFLEVAKFWIDSRGRHSDRPNSVPNLQEYAQDHLPVRMQTEAVGHAVRATLLYAGITSVGQESPNNELLEVALRLWENVTGKKMHITGGVGAMHNEEMFGPDYYLPNNAYLETCAAVGLAWWAHRMGHSFPEARFADVFERALYNNVLAGISLDGKRFFYQNPVLSEGNHHRWDWHGCPCCPPMLLKLMGGLAGCIYAQDETAIYINHYVGGEARIHHRNCDVVLRQETFYPWEGHIRISVNVAKPSAFPIFLRIPGWCKQYTVRVNGDTPAADIDCISGYIEITRQWTTGDEIDLDLEMLVTLIEANPYVEAARGRVAIQRGPIVYCLESADNADVFGVTLPREPELNAEFSADILGGVVMVRGKDSTGGNFTAVPYYAWDNRNPEPHSEEQVPSGEDRVDRRARPEGMAATRNPMVVWIPREGSWDPERNIWRDPESLSGWDETLYRICWSG